MIQAIGSVSRSKTLVVGEFECNKSAAQTRRWVSGCLQACHIPGMATKRLPRPRDPIQLGKLIVDIAIGQVEDRIDDGKDPAAVERGRKGGLKGGVARARNVPDARRKEIAQNAAKTRWKASSDA
jgi:hypothetical protein